MKKEGGIDGTNEESDGRTEVGKEGRKEGRNERMKEGRKEGRKDKGGK